MEQGKIKVDDKISAIQGSRIDTVLGKIKSLEIKACR